MLVNLSPVLMDESLDVFVKGDVITINGEVFDFSKLPEGATLPTGAIESKWFAGPVYRVDGELTITLLLPHWDNPSDRVAFPEPIRVVSDGTVDIPTDTLEVNHD